MNKRGLLITAWLIVGHAILGALYWGLLQIPESNALMLGTSLLTVLAMLAWGGIVETVGVIGWAHDGTAVSAILAALRRAAWFVPALVVFVLFWLVTGFATAWLAAHRGEIDAWFIARFGWTETGSFHTTVAWLLWFVRYGVGVSVGVACLAAGTLGGASAASRFGWLRRGLSWKTLLVTTAALLVGFFLPWHHVVLWRPASLPATWVQPTFASLKLVLVFVMMNIAWAVVLWRAARQFVASGFSRT